jgi:hypothetical protein
MIKIGLRPNLKYLIQLLVYTFVRNLITEYLIGRLLKFGVRLIYLPLMFMGEFSFGLITYLSNKKYLNHNNKVNEINKATTIELISNESNYIEMNDNGIKVILLIFFASFFDFIEFILSIEVISKFFICSYTIESRLRGITLFSQALFYRFKLNLPIYKHQKLSLIIVFICIIITIITEFIFQEFNIFLSYSKFTFCIVMIFFIQIFNSFLDLIEKYLFEYNHVNPFQCLLLEGVFGLLFSISYIIYRNPLPDLNEYYNDNSNLFIYFILSMILYVILSGFKNLFRIATNKLYSPMAAVLAEYFINPIYIIISFLFSDDFISRGERNYGYFIINVILSIFISLSGCIYNEFLILFFCKLEYDTYDQISFRASLCDGSILYEDNEDNSSD